MYLEYFGLKEKPFSLTPDPRFLFLSESHRQALDHMVYGIREREGFILIVGDIGTGKTTICRDLLEKLEPNTASALILNPMLSESELLEAILEDFGVMAQSADKHDGGQEEYRQLYDNLDSDTQTALELNPLMPAGKVLENILRQMDKPAAAPTKKELIDRLNAYLLSRAETGGNAVLIIDEAQNLSLPVLEQIRILSNLETPRQKLLQIVLVGQLELKRKLEQPGLRQLNQRISVRYQLRPMTLDESKRYVEHRLFVAGSNAAVAFDDDAHRAVYDYARGVPRLINVLCERSMLGAFVDQTRRIDVELVKRSRNSLESNLGEEDATAEFPYGAAEETPDEVHISAETAAALNTGHAEAPKDSVTQPWERGAKGKDSSRKRLLLTAFVVVTVLLAAAIGYRFLGGSSRPKAAARPEATKPAPAQTDTRPAGTANPATQAAAPAVKAVSLFFSIQVGAFQNMEDGIEQMRLLSEQGLGENLYIVPLHLVQLGGRWYRLFYGGFPSSDKARSELMRLVERGTLSAGSARIVETPLAFKLGDYDSRDQAEKDQSDYLSRFDIPSYTFEIEGSGSAAHYRLFAGAFEERGQSTYLADRIDKSGLQAELVERTGLWEGD